MRPITKNNHYIPQFILRNFTSEENRIFHFNKEKMDWESKASWSGGGLTTRKTAQQQHLYTTVENGLLSDGVEQKFAHLEADVAPLIKRIITQRKRITALNMFLSEQDFSLLMFFLTISLRRTPAYLKYINKQFVAALETEDTSDDFFDDVDRKYVTKVKDKIIIHNNFTVPMIFREEFVARIMDELLKFTWFIFCKDGLPGNFLLGDTLLSFQKLPMKEKDNEVYVPIGKNHLLFGYKSSTVVKDSSILMNLDRHSVKKINEFIVGNADKFIFSSNKDSGVKSFIEKVLRDSDYCNWGCVFPYPADIENSYHRIDLSDLSSKI